MTALSILGMIGKVLLILICVIVLILALALFYPIRYQIKGSWRDELKLKAKAYWLFHFLSLYYLVEAGESHLFWKILFFRIGAKETDEERGVSNDDKSFSEEDFFDEEEDEPPKNDDSIDQVDEHAFDKKEGINLSSLDENIDSNGKQKKAIKDSITKLWNKIKKLLSPKHCKKLVKITQKKLEKWLEKIKRLLAFLQKKETAHTYEKLKIQACKLLRYICPTKLYLKGSFATGAPDMTGILFGILCMFPFAYTNRWELQADFESEEFYTDLEFDIRGHVFVFQILAIALSLFFDEECRNCYDEWERLKLERTLSHKKHLHQNTTIALSTRACGDCHTKSICKFTTP